MSVITQQFLSQPIKAYLQEARLQDTRDAQALQAIGRSTLKRMIVQPFLRMVKESLNAGFTVLSEELSVLSLKVPRPLPKTQKWCPCMWKECCSIAVLSAPEPPPPVARVEETSVSLQCDTCNM